MEDLTVEIPHGDSGAQIATDSTPANRSNISAEEAATFVTKVPTGAIRTTLSRLVKIESKIKALQRESKGIRQQYKALCEDVQSHMEVNAVRVYNLDQHSVSLIAATKFPTMSPEFVYACIEKYFQSTERPTALGATEAVFNTRKESGTKTCRLRVRDKKTKE